MNPPFVHAPPQSVRLAALYFAYFAYVGAHAPYFSLYLQSIGTSAWQIGALLGTMQAVRIVAPAFWATLADRSGRPVRWLMVTTALGTLTFVAVAGAGGFAPLLVILVVHSFCSGGTVPLTETVTLASLRGETHRYGSIRLWGSVGFIVAVLAVGHQLDVMPVASLLVTITVLLALTACCAALLADAPPSHRAPLAPVGPILAEPGMIALLAACFLMTVAHGPLYAFYSIHLEHAGYSKSAIGWLWAIGVIAEIVVFWLQPRWSARLSMATVFVASLACAVLRFVVIGFGVDSPALMTAAQVLHGATFGSYHVAALAIIHRRFGAGAGARGQALYMSVSFGAGGMVGAFASGVLWEAAGPAWTFAAASTAAAAGLLVATTRRKMLSAGSAE